MGLIVLVVLGHTWALLPSDGPAGHLYDFVYLWHMPAFVFLSGYLSRGFSYRPDRLWQLVTTLLVPYVLFEGALAWFRLHVGGERLEYLWTDPHFPMWYLLALVVWRLAVPLLRPLGSGAVVLALAICLASGFLDGEWTRWMDLPRILGFLPFFVLGTMLTPERMEWLRGRTRRSSASRRSASSASSRSTCSTGPGPATSTTGRSRSWTTRPRPPW